MASVKVGDTVTVPGDMHGLVKFVGKVAGKQGTFAGVQLASEYAGRGKNSGDVEGQYYFRTTLKNSGIFLPIEKAVKRTSGPSSGSGTGRATPGTPNRLTSFNQGGRTPATNKPSFSQSMGPGALRNGAASPAFKPPMRRESLPRPTSPLRKVNTPAAKALQTPKTRPSMAKSVIGGTSAYKSATRPPNKFSQSLRQPSTTPARTESPTLGPESAFDELPEEEAESTPTPTPAVTRNRDSADTQRHEVEKQRLQRQLDEKTRALQDQALSISEMEKNLTELQRLMPGLSEGASSMRSSIAEDEDELPKDVVNLRAALREKNEKIKLLTVEFDANRADFRSTIDTLEMASTETERVYEKRVDELLEEVRTLQDRSEDVESVAQQLRQLEELVQELEEGLEDARRGEAEARGEVEFLRGEVERSRSELRRERERFRTEEHLNGYGSGSVDGDRIDELATQLDSKEDEIRGLKAIIHNLNNTSTTEKPKTNGVNHVQHARQASIPQDSGMQQQIRDLEALLQQKSAHEEELQHEVKQLRNSVSLHKFPMPGSSSFGLRTGSGHSRNNSDDLRKNLKHASSGTQGSQRTVVLSPGNSERREYPDPGSQAHSPVRSPLKSSFQADPAHVETDSVSDAGKSEGASSAALWCEICEENGHDILTCGNMISSKPPSQPSHSQKPSIERPAPLVSRKSNLSMNSNPSQPPTQALPEPPMPKSPAFSPPNASALASNESSSPAEDDEGSQKELKAPIEGTGEQAGMWAGKSSGKIDPDKWCALCERDGHESVDCPIEDAF